MIDERKSLPRKELNHPAFTSRVSEEVKISETQVPNEMSTKQEAPVSDEYIGVGFNSGLKPTLPTSEKDGKLVFEPEVDERKVPVEKTESRFSQIRRRILLWIRDIAIAVLVAILIMQFVRPTVVQQHSMEDTLHENDYIFLNRQTYNFGEIKHNDIFVFKYTPPLGTPGAEKNMIKRVIGLPGDEVAIRDGKVYVNDKVIDDSYTKDGYTDGYMDPMPVPEGYIFALGDNRQNSFDSRDPMMGLIDMRDIIGKAVFRVFPVGDAGFVN